MRPMEHKLVEPIKLIKQDEALYLVIKNKKMRIASEIGSQIEFAGDMAVQGFYSTVCEFKINRKKNQFFVDKKTIAIFGHNFIVNNNSVEISGQHLYQYDEKGDFCSTIQSILDEKIVKQVFDDYIIEQLESENVDWSQEEEKIALRIYLESKGGQYSTQLDLTQVAIDSGELKRSAAAIDMKINCYKALDSEADIAGLGNTGKNTKATWELHKSSKNN